MSTRLVLAVVFLFSSFLLFLFSSMMKNRSVSFAVICAKHGWDPALKAHGLTKAAVFYLFAGVIALTGELILGWFFRTQTGVSVARCLQRTFHRGWRLLFGKSSANNSNNIYNTVKNSDDSEDDDNDDGSSPRRKGRRRTGNNGESSGTSESDFEMMNSAGTERRKLPTHLRRSKNTTNTKNVNDEQDETMVYGGIAALPTREIDANNVPSAVASSGNNNNTRSNGW